VPAHTELAWILNTITYLGELKRMTQFKDKATRYKENVNVGLFDYPVLMAADILLYQTNVVPVGQDQLQHVELARTLAHRFNQLYGETFTIPQPLIGKGAKIMGLDDPTKKMSKSAKNPGNYIALTDDVETIRKKIARAVTDSGYEVKLSPDKPAISNLLTIYHLLSNIPIKDLEKKYTDKGYAKLKKDLAEVIINFLKPIQEKIKTLDQKTTNQILAAGTRKAQTLSQLTLNRVKEKMGLI
jgi:tryptophanyl-tRNA synthetase